MKHGASAYRSAASCRCSECTADHTARAQRERQARAGRDDIPHGTWTAYVNWGCRCDDCRWLYRFYNARQRVNRRGGVAVTELEQAAMAYFAEGSERHGTDQ